MMAAWAVALVTIAVVQVAVTATSIYLHRALAHRSLKVNPLADATFRAVLWLTTGQSRQEWVADHREHHTFMNGEGHSHSLGAGLLARPAVQRRLPHPRGAPRRDPLFSHGALGLRVGLSVLCGLIGLGPGLVARLLHPVSICF